MRGRIVTRAARLVLSSLYIATIVIANGIVQSSTASAIAAVNYAGSAVVGDVEETIAITGLTVGYDEPTVPINLSVDDGILYMETTDGLSFENEDRGQDISFSGSVSDVNAALATLHYRSIEPGTKTITLSILEAGQVFYPNNGHFYEVVNAGGSIDWDSARVAAEGRTLNGATGYLATVTSQAENDFIAPKLDGDGWFGATDAETEGDWKWVTGPESGTSFWAGVGDGSAVGGAFSDWAGGEPNEFAPGEDCAQFYSSGGWNDLPCNYSLSRYIVEYGNDAEIPTTPPSATVSVTISEPTAQTIEIGSCLDLLEVYDNGTTNRYDNLQLTADIDCDGETMLPLFAQEDTDFGYIGFRGTFNGQDNTISNLTISQPIDNNVGLFAVTNGATIENLAIAGSMSGNECVGGIVGYAFDTTLTNNTFSGTLTADGSGTGGMAGCSEFIEGSYSISNNSVTVTMNAGSEVGGILGNLHAYENSIVSVEDNSYQGTFTEDGYYIAGVVGYAISNMSAAVTLANNTTSGIASPGSYYVGGVVGYSQTSDSDSILTIDNNEINGDISGSGNVGGVTGYAYSNNDDNQNLTIRNHTIASNVSSTNDGYVGGIAGYTERVFLQRNSTSGTVSSSDEYAGGLIGYDYSGIITENYASGNVTSDPTNDNIGGLIGYSSSGTINRSYAVGDVEGSNYVGGLIGSLEEGEVSDSYARGSVSASEESGGLIGNCIDSTINRSYAANEITLETDDFSGGIIGGTNSCISTDSFWDVEVGMSFDQSSATGKTTAQMKDVKTFVDTDASEGLESAWDFSEIWSIDENFNDGYPCLLWSSTSCAVYDFDDNDGVGVEVEEAAPNNGDANDDGTPDSEQSNVTSLKSTVNDMYVVLESTTCEANNTVLLTQETDVTEQDDDYYQYPSGLLDFSLSGCSVGGSETVVQYYYGDYDASRVVIRKYDPASHAYTTIDADITNVVINENPAIRVSYVIVDGGELDADGEANGAIVDPVGLAVIDNSALLSGTPVSPAAPDTGYNQTPYITAYLPVFGVILVVITYANNRRKIAAIERKN